MPRHLVLKPVAIVVLTAGMLGGLSPRAVAGDPQIEISDPAADTLMFSGNTSSVTFGGSRWNMITSFRVKIVGAGGAPQFLSLGAGSGLTSPATVNFTVPNVSASTGIVKECLLRVEGLDGDGHVICFDEKTIYIEQT